MPYLYDTHLHTRCASACSSADPKAYVASYQEAGFTGIIITDHFFNGNCRIPQGPWKDMVDAYCRGYEEALEEGYRRGFSVFFGWESTYDGDDYLVYGLDKAWLLEHPQILGASRAEQLRLVHEGGGAVIQAHPFRNRSYIKALHLAPGLVDGVEVANEGNLISFDQSAYAYARRHKLYMTAGSDIHCNDAVGPMTYGVCSPTKWNSIADYVNQILRRIPLGLHCPEECFNENSREPELPVIYC